MDKERAINQGMQSFYNGFAELLKCELTNVYDNAMEEADKRIADVKANAEVQYSRLRENLYNKEDQLEAERVRNQSLQLQLNDKDKVIDAVPLFKNTILPFMEQLLLNIHLAEDGGESNSILFEDLQNTVDQFLLQDVNMNSKELKVVYSEPKMKGRVVDTQSFEVVPKETFEKEMDGTFYRTLRPGLNLNGKPLIFEKVEILKYRGETFDRRFESPKVDEDKHNDVYDESAKTQREDNNESGKNEPTPAPQAKHEESPAPKKEEPLEYGLSVDNRDFTKVAFTDSYCKYKIGNSMYLIIGTRRGKEPWKGLYVMDWSKKPHPLGVSYHAYLYMKDDAPCVDVYYKDLKIDSVNLKEI